MKYIPFPLNRMILPLAVVCATFVCCMVIPAEVSAAGKAKAAPAPESKAAGRLVITRSATLGAYGVGLSVDGKQVATINYNGRYDAPLAAGSHVLSVIPIPNRMSGKTRETKVTIAPGQTLSFTAKRDNDDYILK
ncbi:MAG: hypothetical protein ABIR38_09170 [Chthoniobacterales bacterium]